MNAWEMIYKALGSLGIERLTDKLHVIETEELAESEKIRRALAEALAFLGPGCVVKVESVYFGPFATAHEAGIWVNESRGDVDCLKYTVLPLKKR